jgi:hypothetical protein
LYDKYGYCVTVNPVYGPNYWDCNVTEIAVLPIEPDDLYYNPRWAGHSGKILGYGVFNSGPLVGLGLEALYRPRTVTVFLDYNATDLVASFYAQHEIGSSFRCRELYYEKTLNVCDRKADPLTIFHVVSALVMFLVFALQQYMTTKAAPEHIDIMEGAEVPVVYVASEVKAKDASQYTSV